MSDASLAELVEKARRIKMSPADLREQRLSFARGQLGLCNPNLGPADICRLIEAADKEIFG